ncbi:hypothetical protein LUZ60_006861 [Juncus effusus]|nr:hypothetical protein LUZ60_006861 [Juncus effusus]
MKVVALVSGGKDSCFAMMRSIEFGHEIVALANLIPLDETVDELNSYMYQTAGHQIIVSYAHCMGLPLFQRKIQGSSREVGANYRATPGDEVEDLYVLLKEIKNRLPDVNAVCSGAIASDYQRVRVESVCARLGLVSLAWLWKQNQTELLEEMIRRGIVAITVKVAVVGLNPSEHLGKELKDLKSHLLKLKEKFGINVCGEGGEYESLTLDCPLFHNARIIIDKYETLLDSADSFIAPVGILHPLTFHLVPKNSNSSNNSSRTGFSTSTVYQIDENPSLNNHTAQSKPSDSESGIEIPDSDFRISRAGSKTFSLCCWIDNKPSRSSSENSHEKLSSILKQVESQLISQNLSWTNVLYVHLYIPNMKHFTKVNEIYVQQIQELKCRFGVPSRSTVELPLSESGIESPVLEVLVAREEPGSKRVLHVQSISCWAPSCIGPYSQATLHNQILYMAGQLGLDPPTMLLQSGGATSELNQALQNCQAVASEFKSSVFKNSFVFVVYCSVRMTESERSLVEAKLNGVFSVVKTAFLYVLASDLPKGASVELKPVIYIPDFEETEEQQIEMKELKVMSKNEIQLDESCFKIRKMSNGNLLSAVVSITDKIASESLEQKNDFSFNYESHDEIKSIASFCASLVSTILKENCFSWDDLTILRFYYPTKFSLGGVNLYNIFSDEFANLAKVDEGFKICDDPCFNLVPVLGSGQSALMDDVITCELFASKL